MVELYFIVYFLIHKGLNIPVIYLGRYWVLSSLWFRERKSELTLVKHNCGVISASHVSSLRSTTWTWHRCYPHFWGSESSRNLPKATRLGTGTLRFQAQSFLITEPEFFWPVFFQVWFPETSIWSKWVCQNAGFLVPPEIHWTRLSWGKQW